MRGGGEGCGDVHFRGGVRAALAQVRYGGQQGLGVFVLGVVEDLGGRPGFHDHAAAHHGDPVRQVGHDAHVVGDQDDRAVQLVAQVAHEVQDFGLDRHVEGRGGFVGDQQLGIAGQRLGDHGALPLAAGELVGVGAERLLRVRQLHELKHAQGAQPGLVGRDLAVQPDRLHDLGAHGVDRVQGRHGLLEDHGHFLAADGPDVGLVRPQQLLSGELDASGHTAVARQQAQQGHGAGTLARAGLPHDRQHLAGAHLVVQADGGRHPFLVHAEVDAEAADLEYGFAPARRRGDGRIEGDEVSHDGAFLPPGPPVHRGLVLRLGILNYWGHELCAACRYR